MKKLVWSLILILIFISGILTLNYLSSKKKNQTPVSDVTPSPTAIQEISENVEEEIEAILANKYGRPINEVKVTIQSQNDSFVGGSVLFGDGGPGEGGMFLARKVNNTWEVVFDGNGNVDCTKMRETYGFPDDILIPNFCN